MIRRAKQRVRCALLVIWYYLYRYPGWRGTKERLVKSSGYKLRCKLVETLYTSSGNKLRCCCESFILRHLSTFPSDGPIVTVSIYRLDFYRYYGCYGRDRERRSHRVATRCR
ncbi:unnamed protein product [Amoebophrya sp. A120]|nr:unnamed protein product [Amoebophrya sp. A120]|eukprot:GSA120T00010953001.1